MRKSITVVLFMFVSIAMMQAQADQGLPSNPQSGKCYVKCVTPDKFETREERIEVRPAYTTITTSPAVYETVEERVLVKEASKRFVFHPAEYETVDVPYISKDARNDLRVVAASFGSDSRRIEVYPAVSRWEYSRYADCPSADPNDCQILCWKEYPAQFQDVSLTPLSSDAKTEQVPVTEVRASYKKQVVKKPAYVEEIEIPAEYAVITKQRLVTPAKKETVTVPAEFKTVTKQVLVEKGGVTVWEEIDCKLTEANILPIFYEFNSAVLTGESKNIIDNTLLTLMRDEPNISVELASHTDARGDDAYNLALSQRRAQSVVNYLISKGVNRNRLVAKGYGETRLINRCENGVECTEEEHQRNRRTEFRVISGN